MAKIDEYKVAKKSHELLVTFINALQGERINYVLPIKELQVQYEINGNWTCFDGRLNTLLEHLIFDKTSSVWDLLLKISTAQLKALRQEAQQEVNEFVASTS